MSLPLKKIQISNQQINPKVLKVFIYTQGRELPERFRIKERYVYDYELELITYSRGSMMIEEKEHPVYKGDIVLPRPGQYTQGIMPYSCCVICFDMLGTSAKSSSKYDIYAEQDFHWVCQNPILDAIPSVYHPLDEKKYIALFDSIYKEFINPSIGNEIILKSSVLNLIYQLYHDATNPLIGSNIPLSSHYKLLKKVLDFINNHLEEKILLKDLAVISGLSPNHFHKVFTQTMGITPIDFINKLKIERAKDLLASSNFRINEISLKLGFENIPYFSYLFKKLVGTSPGAFRKKHSYANFD